ncbi:tlg2 [Candida oxycetoniae]|uniref:Tlg2 n=1 Tax=Candida oxycetoniae TaxID=497107 RepID=A0AAI9SX75_9ASCO|nr:tlg2 [Candida oxycetoniae]KAI3404417.2 tlg2 [Candida oxycetoniae]
MFRDRTKLFLSYRRTITRDEPNSRLRNPFSDEIGNEDEDMLTSEQDNLILSSRKHQNRQQQSKSKLRQDIEMKPIIPTQFEIAKDLDIHLNVISKQTQDLQSLYKQLIIINKSQAKKEIESQIEESNYQILKNFEKCYIAIKKFEYLAKNYSRLKIDYSAQDLEVLNNMKKNYANKIQQHLIVFRNLQSNYMNFLRDDDDEFDLLINEKRNEQLQKTQHVANNATTSTAEEFSKELLQTQTQMQQQNQDMSYLEQREKEINKLAMGILEISTIFKEMESMVIDQGTILDRIDYNLTSTVQDLQSSDKELIRARTYQKRTTKCKIIFFLVLCVFALLMIFILRPSSHTKIIEKPTEKPEDKKPTNEVNHPDAPLDDGS